MKNMVSLMSLVCLGASGIILVMMKAPDNIPAATFIAILACYFLLLDLRFPPRP